VRLMKKRDFNDMVIGMPKTEILIQDNNPPVIMEIVA